MGEDYLYDFWQFGLLALVQTIILQGKITGFLPPPTHSPWKQTPFMIQKRPHHFIHKVMCFFFPQKMSSALFLLQLKFNTVALQCDTFLLTAWAVFLCFTWSQKDWTFLPFLVAYLDRSRWQNLDRNGGWKAAKHFGVISAFSVNAAECNKSRLQPVCTLWRF